MLHGEDAIAINIASALQSLAIPALTLAALPLVGRVMDFIARQIPGRRYSKVLFLGGFNNMDSRQFWRDLRGGLFTLTRTQLMTVKQWAQAGGKILAIGDIVPLAMAWHSGANYAFVGTAKSEYYLRQPSGEWLESTPPWEKWLGSAYYPWECWLMQRRRCYGVFPRDQLTHQILSRKGVQSHNVGNPMMDGLGEDASPNPQNILENSHAPLVLLLLPGSRLPEALENWRLILESFPPLFDQFPNRPLILIAAIAPALALEPFQKALSLHQWQALPKANFLDSTAPSYQYQTHQLILSQHHYADCLQQAHAAIALAGTATE